MSTSALSLNTHAGSSRRASAPAAGFRGAEPYLAQSDLPGHVAPRRWWALAVCVGLAAVMVWAVAHFAAGASGVVPASDPGGAAVSSFAGRAGSPGVGASVLSPVAPVPSVYVVQPGDTVWSIARALHPHGDIAPLVAEISAANGGVSLDVGQRLVVP
jgi:LysM repeat protein